MFENHLSDYRVYQAQPFDAGTLLSFERRILLRMTPAEAPQLV
jgi:hypothetical protein